VNVLVDTSVWSLALRRVRPSTDARVDELLALVGEGRAAILGLIRQELLSGVRAPAQFDSLRERLRDFPDVELVTEDYEEAAAASNRCRARGVQGSLVDFLICAAASRREMPILTADEDFVRYARILPIELYRPRA
jgi:predicted nucleic acid-binding protein